MMARRLIASLEAELEEARRNVSPKPQTPMKDSPRKPSPLVVPPSPYVVAKTPGGGVRENPTSETRSFQLRELPNFRTRLGDSGTTVETVCEDSETSSDELIFSSTKDSLDEDLSEALALLSCEEEQQALVKEGFDIDDWLRGGEDNEEWFDKTASFAAFSAAARKVELETDDMQKITPWVRAAILAEAEHVSRCHPKDQVQSRVRFRRYDFSSVGLPIDTVPGSELEAEAVAKRLAAVREAEIELDDEAKACLARLETGLRLSAEEHDARESCGAAFMWADEAASVLSAGQTSSPVTDKLSELLSTVIRFHLRRLFNAPPLPTAKRALCSQEEVAEKRVPLATIIDDNQQNSEEDIRKSAASRQRRDSLGGRGEVDEEHNPYAWSRSEVHKHIKLAPNHEAVSAPEGALASQLVVALGHLAAAGNLCAVKRASAKIMIRPDDILTARDRLDNLGPRLIAACATRFLYRLLDFPDLDRLIEGAGGWGPVENYASLAVSYASDPVAALFQHCAHIGTFKAYLGEQIQRAEVDRKELLAETNELGLTFGPRRRLPGAREIGDQARALARMARAYPECLSA